MYAKHPILYHIIYIHVCVCVCVEGRNTCNTVCNVKHIDEFLLSYFLIGGMYVCKACMHVCLCLCLCADVWECPYVYTSIWMIYYCIFTIIYLNRRLTHIFIGGNLLLYIYYDISYHCMFLLLYILIWGWLLRYIFIS